MEEKENEVKTTKRCAICRQLRISHDEQRHWQVLAQRVVEEVLEEPAPNNK